MYALWQHSCDSRLGEHTRLQAFNLHLLFWVSDLTQRQTSLAELVPAGSCNSNTGSVIL